MLAAGQVGPTPVNSVPAERKWEPLSSVRDSENTAGDP